MTGSTVEPLSDWQDVLGNEIVALQLALVRVVGESASDVAVFRTQHAARNRDCQRNLSSRLLRAGKQAVVNTRSSVGRSARLFEHQWQPEKQMRLKCRSWSISCDGASALANHHRPLAKRHLPLAFVIFPATSVCCRHNQGRFRTSATVKAAVSAGVDSTPRAVCREGNGVRWKSFTYRTPISRCSCDYAEPNSWSQCWQFTWLSQ